MEADQDDMTVSLSVVLSLAVLLPNCSCWLLPAKSASASRVSKMKGLESTEDNPEGLDFCPGAHTWDRAVLPLHMELCPAALEWKGFGEIFYQATTI
ncbi:hypothetical protein D623_10028881 [Myotis brandtii]|uniref:Uncharacterized protein n=1 Tax=Myotis brandtii TaxID=109478 RepID=S7MX39_MYOBR|nr:hypothetical protein D623_10028881 [Myotis brandtii]